MTLRPRDLPAPVEGKAARAVRMRALFGRKAEEAETTAAASADPLLRQCWNSIARQWREDEARR